MKAVYVHKSGGPEALIYAETPQPYPKQGEVLVRVHAAGVTATELEWAPTWTTRTGDKRPFPIILGHEFSGVVAALGTGVTDVSESTPVYGLNDWFENGAQAEYCITHPEELAPKPQSIDHLQAAAVPIAALTAWQGLFDRARLAENQSVLIHGAAGSVGSFAVQLACWRGAHVIGTASAQNTSFVRDLGAGEVIDYKAMRFEDVVHDVDVVFDTVGGETLERSWDVLKPGGRLVTIAAQSEKTENQAVRDSFFIVEANRPQLIEIARLIDIGQIRPVVDTVFPLSQGREAYERKPARGKIVLRVTN